MAAFERISAKLTAGFGLMMLLIAACGAFGLYETNKGETLVTKLIDEDAAFLENAKQAHIHLLELRRDEKDILINVGNPEKQRAYLEDFHKDARAAREVFVELSQRIQADDELPAELKEMSLKQEELFQGYYQGAVKVLNEAMSGQLTPAEANGKLGDVKKFVHGLEEVLIAAETAGDKMLEDVARETIAEARLSSTILAATLGIGLLLGLLATVYLVRAVTRPLSRVVDYAEDVSGGNLDAQARGTFAGEMAELVSAISSMVETLKAKMAEADRRGQEAAKAAEEAREAGRQADEARQRAESARKEGLNEAANQLDSVVQSLSSASAQLAAQVEQVSAGADQQRERTTEVATSMEEMNATVLEVARNASGASDSAEEAHRRADDGSQAVERVVEAIDEVRGQSQTLSRNLSELGERASGIGQVMNVITDIADQTNLLALNAAIEAARAGDAGRGFAVVADEVRKLAEKTMQATSEVGEAVRAIQDSSRRSIDGMSRSDEAVERSTELAREAGQALQQIVEIVSTTNGQVQSIAAAGEEQSAASEEINRAIEDINLISGETAEGMNQAREAMEELARLSSHLQDMVEKLSNA